MVDAVNSSTSSGYMPSVTGAETSKDTKSATLNYESFLKLLVAQMKNQDPTEPMDATQQMAQLATFSQVEQSMQSNSKLDSLLSSLALSQADGIIGRTLTSEDGSVSGKVTAVRIVNGGALADLDSGKSVVLGPGVIIT